MANADSIRRETEERERQRADSQAAQTQQTERNAVAGQLSRLHGLAHEILGWRDDRDLAEAKQASWHSLHLNFSKPTETPAFLMTMCFVLLLIYPAVYWLDVFLLSGNAKQLAKDFAQGNQTLIYGAIFAIPMAILLTETYFQTQWSVAIDSRQNLLWGTASIFMCLVMPATIVGFSMSTSVSNGGTRTAQVQNWHLIGKAAMAFFAHAAILLGGKRLHEAKNYLIFKIADKRLELRINRLGRETRDSDTTLTNTFTQYFQQLNDFNAAHVANRIEPGPFDEITRNEINRAFGYEIIALPPGPNPPTHSGADNVSNNGVIPVNGPAPAAPDQNDQLGNRGPAFDMEGEDEVRP